MRLVDALTEWRAGRWLATLGDRLGSDGLDVAAVLPGLGAAVDQHAAAVRNTLLGHGGSARSDRVLLAEYGRGLLARADVTLLQLRDEAAVRWTRADWITLRLLAVCALDRSLPARSRSERARTAWSRGRSRTHPGRSTVRY